MASSQGVPTAYHIYTRNRYVRVRTAIQNMGDVVFFRLVVSFFFSFFHFDSNFCIHFFFMCSLIIETRKHNITVGFSLICGCVALVEFLFSYHFLFVALPPRLQFLFKKRIDCMLVCVYNAENWAEAQKQLARCKCIYV